MASKKTQIVADDFNDLDFIERTLALRSIWQAENLSSWMKADKASKKEQENEIYSMDIARMTRLHLIYVAFKLARGRVERSSFEDPNIKKHLLNGVKTFALKQLVIDHQGLYEAGYFTKGSGR